MLPELQRIEYGPDELASVWRPRDRIWVNPRVQAGAACIDQTRIPTATVYGIVQGGDDIEDVASDYDIDVEDVRTAHVFERDLRRAA